MECKITGTPVTPDPKRLVSGPCWNLYLRYQLFESLSPFCCHDVPCEQQWTHSVFRSVEELVFQACVAVNIQTGGMLLRKCTRNGESIPALVALWCADKRLFARARWTRTVVFLQSCDRSQSCDLMTSHAWLKSKSHPHCVARMRHTFSKLFLCHLSKTSPACTFVDSCFW